MFKKIIKIGIVGFLFSTISLNINLLAAEDSNTADPFANHTEIYAPPSKKNLYCKTPTNDPTCTTRSTCFQYSKIESVTNNEETQVSEADCVSPSQIVQLIPNGKNPQDILATYVSGAFTFALGLGALFAVLRVIYGGIQVIISKEDISEGKNKIMSGIVGIVFLLLSAMILRTINPNFFIMNNENSTDTTTNGELKLPTDVNK